MSRYVCELVREKLNGDGLETKIERIVGRMIHPTSEVKEDDFRKAIDNFDF